MRIVEHWRNQLVERTLTAHQPAESHAPYFPPRIVVPRSVERYTFTPVAELAKEAPSVFHPVIEIVATATD